MAQWSFGQRQPSREAESTGRTLELLNQLSTSYGKMKLAVAQEEKRAAEMGARRRVLDAFKASSFREVPAVEKDATGKERNVKKVEPVSHQEFLANYFDTRAQLSQLGASKDELEGLDVAAKEWYQKEETARPASADQTLLTNLISLYGPEEGIKRYQNMRVEVKASGPTGAATTITDADGRVTAVTTTRGGAAGTKPQVSTKDIGATPEGKYTTPAEREAAKPEKATVQIYAPKADGGFDITTKDVPRKDAARLVKTSIQSSLRGFAGDLIGIGVTPDGLEKLNITEQKAAEWGAKRGTYEKDPNLYFDVIQDNLLSDDPAVVARELEKANALVNAAYEQNAGNAEYKDVLQAQVANISKAREHVKAALHMYEQGKEYFKPVPAQPAAQAPAAPAPAQPAAKPGKSFQYEWTSATKNANPSIIRAMKKADDENTPYDERLKIIKKLASLGYAAIKE